MHVRLCCDRRQAWAFTGYEPKISTQGLWHQEDIGKEDGRIETIAANGLQCDFGREVGIIAKLKEVTGFCARCAIFGQISACLSHHPDRRYG